ncbi:MAG TPA: GNAT family N-acetyltransferase [Allosphingosinicella sp.]|jgi:RimJ/RimL family protein N-acetyltransferase
MFAITPRLLLRPGWREDAPAVFAAVADEAIVRNLAQVPWPYRLDHAEEWLATPQQPAWPSCLIFLRGDPTRVAGCVGLHPAEDGRPELGYWLARPFWGRGIATEAAGAIVAAARHSLRLPRLVSGHFTDNPASGRVLEKLGFRATGMTRRYSAGRGESVPCRLMELDLAEVDSLPAIAA